MPVFYLDSSALVKRYQHEAGTEVIDELLESASPGDRFYTSFLSVLEVTSAVHRLMVAGQLQEGAGHEILARLRLDLRARFLLWPLNDDVVSAAVSVVELHKLRSADAIHLASALAIVSLVAGLPVVMVSSDRELMRAARAAGLGILHPLDSDALARLRRLRA